MSQIANNTASGIPSWNTTGFSDSTVAAVFSIVGISGAASASNCTGLFSRLREIHEDQFRNRTSYTIGEVVDALASNILKN